MLFACGPQPLRLSHTASARRKLKALVRAMPISNRELADVIGVEYKTLVNHLAGRTMSQGRRDWYHRVLRIEMHGADEIHVVVRYRPTRKRWGWKLSQEEKRMLHASDRGEHRLTAPEV